MSTAKLHRKRWSRWDDQLLKQERHRTSPQQLAAQLGRTVGAVRARFRANQARYGNSLFAPEELVGKQSLPTRHQASVELFMQLAGQEVPAVPTVPDEATRILRAKIIWEEALETIRRGLGIEPVLCREPLEVEFHIAREVDLVEVADGVADLTFVATGTALACGIKPEPIQLLVDESNLAKFGPGGKRREDGKWLKSPDWQPPKIREELTRQGAQF